MAARVEIAFQHPLGIGRHPDVVGHAFHHRQRGVAQRSHQPELVDRQPHHRGDVIDRVGADHEAHRQRLAGRRARLVDRAQIAGGDQVDAGLAAAAQHQAAHAHIGPAGLRVDDEIDRGGDIGRAVGAVPEMDRERGEIGILAGEHDLLHRRLRARDLDDIGLVAQPPQQLRQQLGRRDPERARDPRAAAGDVADQLLALRADRAEQHRLGIAFEDRRDVGQLGRLAHGRELVAQALHETAQPEAVDIRRCVGAFRLCRAVFSTMPIGCPRCRGL